MADDDDDKNGDCRFRVAGQLAAISGKGGETARLGIGCCKLRKLALEQASDNQLTRAKAF